MSAYSRITFCANSLNYTVWSTDYIWMKMSLVKALQKVIILIGKYKGENFQSQKLHWNLQVLSFLLLLETTWLPACIAGNPFITNWVSKVKEHVPDICSATRHIYLLSSTIWITAFHFCQVKINLRVFLVSLIVLPKYKSDSFTRADNKASHKAIWNRPHYSLRILKVLLLLQALCSRTIFVTRPAKIGHVG